MSVSTEPEDWLKRLTQIRQWGREGSRAPHKPLLLLYVLGRLQSTGKNESLSFGELEAPLRSLLDDYGPPNRTTPAYPFRRLANDGLWVLSTTNGEAVGDDPAGLRRAGAAGQLDPDFAAALQADPSLLARCARLLLERNFPESLHRQISSAVGLEIERDEVANIISIDDRRRRSRAFREEVLLAYEFRCAMCGYEGRLGREVVGLEAAHVRWFALEGPDDLSNGLALCTMHHLLFDRGVLGVSEERTVAVSRHFTGHATSAETFVTALAGRGLGQPQPGLPLVDDLHLTWHREQVFRSPGRTAVQ